MKYKALITAPPILPKIYNYQDLFDRESVEIVIPPYKVEESLDERKLLKLITDVDGILCGDDEISANVLKKAKKLKVPNLGDHRICMSVQILSLITGIKTEIKNFETVYTSSPSFLKIIRSLGGNFEIKR